MYLFYTNLNNAFTSSAIQPITFTFEGKESDTISISSVQYEVIDNVTSGVINTGSFSDIVIYGTSTKYFSKDFNFQSMGLVDGGYYKITFSVNGNESGVQKTWKETKFVHTYSKPSVSITNLPDGNIVRNPSYVFQISADQAQNRPISNYILIIKQGDLEVFNSGWVYTGTSSVPYVGQCSVAGLESNNNYVVQVSVKTTDSIQSNVVNYNITVNYGTPSSYDNIKLTNEKDKGYIHISSFWGNIPGSLRANTSQPYEQHNGKWCLNLSNGGSCVWDANLKLEENEDFVLKLWVYNPNTEWNSGEIAHLHGTGFEGHGGQDIYIERYCNTIQGFRYVTTIAYIKIPNANGRQTVVATEPTNYQLNSTGVHFIELRRREGYFHIAHTV